MILNALIWLDVAIFYLLTLGGAKPGETISSAAWSLHLANKWQGCIFVPFIDLLFRPWGKDHCRKSYIWQIHLYKTDL